MMKKYIKGNDLQAVAIDKCTGICLMQCQAYENKLMDILKIKQLRTWLSKKTVFKIRRENQYCFKGAE